MTEREDKVYKAKLAEQAERYDGKKIKIIMLIICLFCKLFMITGIKLYTQSLEESGVIFEAVDLSK